MKYGQVWTRKGHYNWAKYAPGERIEALPYSPLARTDYVACWYPGKPAVGVATSNPQEALALAEQLPDGPEVVMQEPIPNGAWWVRTRALPRLVGPHSLDDMLAWRAS